MENTAYAGSISQKDFMRFTVEALGRKVRGTSVDGELFRVLTDMVPNSLKYHYHKHNKHPGLAVGTQVHSFLKNNAPKGSVLSRTLRDESGGRCRMKVLNDEAVSVLMHYIYGKSKGIDFRAPWSALPDQIDLPVAA